MIKNYVSIITGNYKCAKSYDYDINKLYKNYYDTNYYDDSNKKETYYYHDSLIIDDSCKVIKLLDSSGKGRIRIWEFHTSNLIKVIELNKYGAYGMCLWDQNYLLVGSKKTIKLIDINKETIIKQFRGHEHEVISINKIEHPKYGKCFISQDREEGSIILWTTNYKII